MLSKKSIFQSMKALELKIPPLLLMLLFAGAIWLVEPALPQVMQPTTASVTVAILLVLAGIIVAVSGVYAFRQAQTTVDPTKPDASSTLVTSGIYRFTRNPMYVGFTLCLTALSAYLASPLSLALVILFSWFLTRFQIMPEERILKGVFGQAYQDYCNKVRRWL